ncbi:predicted protein [Scheffersomyces stipitis CBS 6054]|uniref:Nuclear control of ATPase protein 2 n=1 Tax=Scheffersomyces stipitis (strain ATCC 58785 / CBS 6054 / NBRC 10063 / NRRL Y-11545) TaxID=322104 RepID=A3LPU4_PICST|nr:predicted protein [Scheffersomyces stipitis CBS 6054]ABN65100.2 predicted protein [Scheffersomyces stipitis CBS 6054]
MDFFTPGLVGSSRSSKILNEINNNNRISLKIKQKFTETNELTAHFLSSQLSEFSVELQQSLQDKGDLLILQESFQELYYSLNIENFKFNRVSSLSLKPLTSIYAPVKDIDIDSTVETKLNSINSSTNQLLNYYYIYLITLNLSNSLIYKTLELKSQNVYWEDLYNSRFSKFVYFVQISPIKLYEFGKTVYHHILDKFYLNVTYQSIRKALKAIFINTNPTISLVNISARTTYTWYKSAIRFIWKTPMNLINSEINGKIGQINQEIESNTAMIDTLIKLDLNDKESIFSSLETILSVKSSEKENARIFNILNGVVEFDSKYNSSIRKPSFLTRYWLLLMIVVLYGPSQSLNIYNNRYEIVQWVKHNLVDTTIGFFKNWLIKPITDMLNILRNDDDLTITSKESLRSDLDSLERMVLQFLDDEKITDVNKSQVHELIQNGDLTMLMNKYETEIRSPVKSLVRGSLIRSILIQIQKTKVDGGIAINGIDKLLKSQQLVFGIVSVSPSLIILYQFWNYLTTASPVIVNGKQVNIVCLKSLNNIENLLVLLNENKDSVTIENNYEGELLIEIINLIVSASLIIPKQLEKDWIRDLNELNNSNFDEKTKLELIRKIWNMYGHYFR